MYMATASWTFQFCALEREIPVGFAAALVQGDAEHPTDPDAVERWRRPKADDPAGVENQS